MWFWIISYPLLCVLVLTLPEPLSLLGTDTAVLYREWLVLPNINAVSSNFLQCMLQTNLKKLRFKIWTLARTESSFALINITQAFKMSKYIN